MVNRISLILNLLMVFLGIAVSCPFTSGSVTWGYPSDSTLGQCIVNLPYNLALFPDRATALETVQVEYNAAVAYCAAVPDPKPNWCSKVYYWEGSCSHYLIPACQTTCICGGIGTCPNLVSSCYFACYNCRDPGWDYEHGNWRKTLYWYYICSPTYPPPSQVDDPPITTQITDKNTGGNCPGRCDMVVGGQEGK